MTIFQSLDQTVVSGCLSLFGSWYPQHTWEGAAPKANKPADLALPNLAKGDHKSIGYSSPAVCIHT